MTDPTISTGDSGYAPVNGLQMYYEVHGAERGRWSCSTATCPPSASTSAGSSRRWPRAARSSAWSSRPTATLPTSTARCPSRTGPATPSPCGATWGSGRPTCSATAPGRRWPCSSPSTTRSWSAGRCSPRPATGWTGCTPLLDSISEVKPEHLAGTPFEQDYQGRAQPRRLAEADREDHPDERRPAPVVGRPGHRRPDHAHHRRLRHRPARARRRDVPPARGRSSATWSACSARGWPCSPAPPTSPWCSGPTGCPRWSASSSTPNPAEPGQLRISVAGSPGGAGSAGPVPLDRPDGGLPFLFAWPAACPGARDHGAAVGAGAFAAFGQAGGTGTGLAGLRCPCVQVATPRSRRWSSMPARALTAPGIGRSRPAIPGSRGELCRNGRGRPVDRSSRGQEGWVVGLRWGRRAPEASQAAPWRRSVASWRLLR